MRAPFDPRALVIAVLTGMVATFLVHSWIQALIVVCFFLSLAALTRTNPLRCVRAVAAPLCFLLVVASLNLFFTSKGTPLFHLGPFLVTTEGVRTFALYAVRLSFLVLFGSILLLGIPSSLLVRALESLLKPLQQVGVPVATLADIISMALRFMNSVSSEYDLLQVAQVLRGKAHRGDFLFPFMRALFRRADTVALALDARAYEPSQKRTYLTALHFRACDASLCAFCGGLLVFLGLT